MARILSWLLALTGLALLGLGAYICFVPAPEPALEVVETDIDLPGCKAGKKTEVEFHFVNHSSKPLHVVGLAGC
jgi:hypothetical protein